MKFEIKIFIAACVMISLLVQGGCSCQSFREIDEKNIRGQLHVPKDIPLVFFDSNPKEAGWFGREGLRIWAVFQFNAKQVAEYLKDIETSSTWKPVRYINYSPGKAEEYASNAFLWSESPPPTWKLDMLRGWQYMEDIREIKTGKFYCSAVVGKQGEKADDGKHRPWKYIGVPCSDVAENGSRIISTLGTLDLETGKLYAFIAFSG